MNKAGYLGEPFSRVLKEGVIHTNNMIIKIVSDDIYYWKIGLMISQPALPLREMEIDEKMYSSLKRSGCWRSSYHYYSKFGSEHLKMSQGTWLITIALKKPTDNFPWKQAKEDNSERTFLMIVNKLFSPSWCLCVWNEQILEVDFHIFSKS